MTDPTSAPGAASHFIRDLIAADVRSGKHQGRVVTRFPPEPNGYLHIGHAKSICLNFGMAQEFGGQTNLRFDDTNPTTENVEYVRSIEEAVRWLGFQWSGEVRHASGYFEQLYQWAVQLIRQGDAYVCSLTEGQMREYRGTVLEAGKLSPFASRTVAENLDLFARMRAGEFADGAHTLRARIDMSSANMKMRDPPLYRIRRAHHYRTGDTWCIYPLYDYAHCLSDAIEGITHSICTLEFENNRELYDWLIAKVGFANPPHQYEFARLNLTYMMMSKRKLNTLVQEKRVSGWDDPRIPTLLGLRRRGVTASALRAFCEEIGVAKTNSILDLGRLENAIRDDLEPKTPRVLGVLRPLKLVIDNYPAGPGEVFDAPSFPEESGKPGTRKVPFSRELFIEREDFHDDALGPAPKGFRRLALGTEVRLRHAYFVTCTSVVRDASGAVTEVHCTYDAATRGGQAPDGRKVRGTLHWVSAAHALEAEVRLYDVLFTVEQPDDVPEGKDWRDTLNPDSLIVLKGARLEPSLASAAVGEAFQFERQGFFALDPDSKPGALVFNRTVALKDAFAKKPKVEAEPVRKEPEAKKPQSAAPSFEERVAKLLPEQTQAFAGLVTQGLSRDEALALALDAKGRALFDEALAVHPAAKSVARWIGELSRVNKGREPAAQVPGRALGELALLVDQGTLTGTSAKDVLDEMVRSGRGPAAIVESLGLQKVSGKDALGPVVDGVLAKHPEEVARYRAGNKNLTGFFVGLVMKAAGGQAEAKVVRELVAERLG